MAYEVALVVKSKCAPDNVEVCYRAESKPNWVYSSSTPLEIISIENSF